MPDDSAGNATRPASPVPVTGQGADAPQVNVPIDDIYASLNRRHFSDGRKSFTGNQNFNGYRATGAGDAVDAQDFVTLSQVQALIAAVQGVPTGFIGPLTGSVVPAGWVIANGQALSRTTYATFWTWVQASGNLAATEGAKTVGQYGPGDGSTTFTLPNLYADNGYFIRPVSSGRTIGTVQADDNKSHAHTASTGSSGIHNHSVTIPGSGSSASGGAPILGPQSTVFSLFTSTDGAHTHTVTVDPSGGTESRPKNIAFPVIIKT